MSSTFILDGYQTGPWDFQNNAVKAYDTLTFGDMKLKNHTFYESINGSGGMNVRFCDSLFSKSITRLFKKVLKIIILIHFRSAKVKKIS